MDGVVTRLNVTAPAAEAPAAPAVVATETANGGVTVRKAEETTAENKDGLILGKFKTDEDVRKAYVELEKKLGAGSKKEETPATPAAPAAPVVDAAAAAAKGIDLKALSDEYIAGGNKLSDASMAKLTAAGITAEQVSSYIAGQQAVAEKLSTDLAAVVGGSEKLTATLEWARVNATDEQKAAFDAALDSGNIPLLKLALGQIDAAHKAAVGTDPALVKAEQVPTITGPKPFASQQEMMTAMKDPRYKKGDRAYIKTVEQRIAASNLWGAQS